MADGQGPFRACPASKEERLNRRPATLRPTLTLYYDCLNIRVECPLPRQKSATFSGTTASSSVLAPEGWASFTAHEMSDLIVTSP